MKPTHWPEDVQVAKVIPPGSDPVEMRVVTGIKPERDWKVKADWGDGRIHVHGTVTYSDLNNVTHVTGFYRYSTSDVNRFVLPTREDIKRDYEYEDYGSHAHECTTALICVACRASHKVGSIS